MRIELGPPDYEFLVVTIILHGAIVSKGERIPIFNSYQLSNKDTCRANYRLPWDQSRY